jgi:hypothetical protein
MPAFTACTILRICRSTLASFGVHSGLLGCLLAPQPIELLLERLKHPNPPLPAHDGYFRQVTDVAWDKAGNAFISDGYINSRVAKVD